MHFSKEEKQVKKKQKPQVLLHTIAILYSIACIIPFIVVVSASITHPFELSQVGYGLFPNKVDLTAYRAIFEKPQVILRSYGVTAYVTAATLFFGVLFMSMA